MKYRLIHADVMDGLRSLHDESVQCVVTSPPYWGLRDYGIEPRVWGGDLACVHAWGEPVRSAKANDVPGPNGRGGKNGDRRNEQKWTGPFCLLCNAWRGTFGLEPTPDMYVAHAVTIFRELRRVLRKDGTLWLNIGDTYAGGGMPGTDKNKASRYGPRGAVDGIKAKDLVGIPWMVAFALRADGWYLRSDIIWNKPNPMPESVTDRPTRSHEYLFLLAKRSRYLYDANAIKERRTSNEDAISFRGGSYVGGQIDNQTLGKRRVVGNRLIDKQRGHSRRHAGFNERWDKMSREDQMANGRNKRSVWTIATQPFPEAHFATFPEALVEPCILAGSRVGDTVLDPFNGSGTTGVVALKHQRDYVGIELNADYLGMARRRLSRVAPMFAQEIPA